MSRHSWKVRVSGLKLWIGLVMPKRHGSLKSSSTKVPNSLSQMMSTPAKLRSMYLALLAWCTLWWEGVENPLQPAELAHHLGVDEELKPRLKSTVATTASGEADEDHGDPEQPHAGDRVHQALAKGGGEVEPLRAVVHHVEAQPAHVVLAKWNSQ
jgi:hypothetical protein